MAALRVWRAAAASSASRRLANQMARAKVWKPRENIKHMPFSPLPTLNSGGVGPCGYVI